MPNAEETLEAPSTPPQEMRDVFDKSGKRHTMLRLNAHDMVQHCGWSYNMVVVHKSAPEKVVVLVSKTASAVKPEDAEQIDLATLSDVDLKAFAALHFDMSFNESVSREDVMSALLLEQTA